MQPERASSRAMGARKLAVHPDGLKAAKAARTPGLCLFCEEPLPKKVGKGRKRLICPTRACLRAYCRSLRRDHPEYRERDNLRRRIKYRLEREGRAA